MKSLQVADGLVISRLLLALIARAMKSGWRMKELAVVFASVGGLELRMSDGMTAEGDQLEGGGDREAGARVVQCAMKTPAVPQSVSL